MRPIGLLLAACLCAILLYDRVSGPLSAVEVAAAPGPGNETSHQPTHLEKLQHCLTASQLLEIELAKHRELRRAELSDMTPAVEATFRKDLSKELQATWDRMHDAFADEQWKRDHFETKAVWDKEFHDKAMLGRHYKLFLESLTDPRTEASKAWAKVVEKIPAEKAIRAQGELVLMFNHERDVALAALK
jgi:hypothetical protein